MRRPSAMSETTCENQLETPTPMLIEPVNVPTDAGASDLRRRPVAAPVTTS